MKRYTKSQARRKARRSKNIAVKEDFWRAIKMQPVRTLSFGGGR